VHSGPASIASRGTPARSSSTTFAAFRSTCHLPATPPGDGATTASPVPPSAVLTASTTSAPTSKQHGPIAGPSAIRRSPGRAPKSAASVRTTAGNTPATVPRQPACAAATAPVRGSTTIAGMQSATNTPSATPGSFVQSASASTRATASGSSPARTCTTVAPCTWRATKSGPPRPAARSSRRRFSATLAGTSNQRAPRLSESYGAGLTPPARVEKPWRNGAPISSEPSSGSSQPSSSR
jgi:hypothetical protein